MDRWRTRLRECKNARRKKCTTFLFSSSPDSVLPKLAPADLAPFASTPHMENDSAMQAAAAASGAAAPTSPAPLDPSTTSDRLLRGGSKRGIQWDEPTIAEHDKERGTRKKILEPKTPFRPSALASSGAGAGSGDEGSGRCLSSAGSVGSAASDDSMAAAPHPDALQMDDPRLAVALAAHWDSGSESESRGERANNRALPPPQQSFPFPPSPHLPSPPALSSTRRTRRVGRNGGRGLRIGGCGGGGGDSGCWVRRVCRLVLLGGHHSVPRQRVRRRRGRRRRRRRRRRVLERRGE